MSSRRKWAEQATSAGRQIYAQLQAHLHTVRARVRTELNRGKPLARPVLAFVLVLVLLSGPAIAPPSNGNGNGGGDGSGIVQSTVCKSEMSTLASAVFSLLILVLSAFGVYRIGEGFRKYGDPRSDVKRKGIESVKGGVISFAGAIFVLVSPDLLTKLGLGFTNCISVTGV